MAAKGGARFVRIDRLSTLIARLVGVAFGAAIAVGIIVAGINNFRESPTTITTLEILIGPGPIAIFGVYLAGQSLLRLARQIRRFSHRIDLDAPEIVILRRRPPRLLPTLLCIWFILFIAALTISLLRTEPPRVGAAVGVGIFLLFVLRHSLPELWKTWRPEANALAPVVLDRASRLDRSIGDMPGLSWRDIRSIDVNSGRMMLAGEGGKWAEAQAPEPRWFMRLWGARPRHFRLQHYGLQPDATYAIALIHAYWQRRITEQSADPRKAGRVRERQS